MRYAFSLRQLLTLVKDLLKLCVLWQYMDSGFGHTSTEALGGHCMLRMAVMSRDASYAAAICRVN